MYETVFDIGNPSTSVIIGNFLIYTLQTVVLVACCAISVILFKRNRMVSLGLFVIIGLTIFMNIAYLQKKAFFKTQLENSNLQTVEGRIEKFEYSGNIAHFQVSNTSFKVSGYGLITPEYRGRNTLESLSRENAYVRIKHYRGAILILEKKSHLAGN